MPLNLEVFRTSYAKLARRVRCSFGGEVLGLPELPPRRLIVTVVIIVIMVINMIIVIIVAIMVIFLFKYQDEFLGMNDCTNPTGPKCNGFQKENAATPLS